MPTALAPIVLFVFNRPWHTRQTVEALKNNDLAKDSNLFIFADGPRNNEDHKTVQDVRQYIRQIDGFRNVSIRERDENMGLARSVIAGVSEIVKEKGRIIVLEDDLITSRSFLRFLNESLSRYQSEERVMHVSGYMFPVKNAERLPDTFFYRVTSCWGWGTWDRAWAFFEPDAALLMKRLKEINAEYDFNVLGAVNNTEMLARHMQGKIDSWAVRWHASVFLQHGLCLHPAHSLVNNIGHDSSGVHSGRSKDFKVTITDNQAWHFADTIQESSEALESIAAFYRSLHKPLFKQVVSRIVNRVTIRKR